MKTKEIYDLFHNYCPRCAGPFSRTHGLSIYADSSISFEICYQHDHRLILCENSSGAPILIILDDPGKNIKIMFGLLSQRLTIKNRDTEEVYFSEPMNITRAMIYFRNELEVDKILILS